VVKIKKFFLKLFSPFANEVWWPNWSNRRWKNAIKYVELKEEDKLEKLTKANITILVKKLYKNFHWTADGITELWDSITPPAQNYQHYLDGELRDDCDGFHSLVYHCLHNNGIECYLLSAIAVGAGHCVLVFKLNDKWYVVDYSTVLNGYDTLQEAIDNYNIHYVDVYNAESEVVYNGLIQYDYQTGKFSSVKNQLLK
jgi:hypothetical protein